MATMTKELLPRELQGKGLTSPMDFDALFRFAQVFQASGMFSDVTDAAQAFVKITRGAELGLPPTASMTAFDIIQKRLFIKPWAIAALINACGYGAYQVMEDSAEQCIIHFRRKFPGQGWVTLEPVRYTIAEAQAHGLIQRSPHWKASPAHMLYQRCMGRGGAMHFPELLAGLQPAIDVTPGAPEHLATTIEELVGPGLDPTAPPPRLSPPAGEEGLPYLARIEAAILAQGGDIESWMVWAERRFRKGRTLLTLEEYQAFLTAVQDAGQQSGPTRPPDTTHEAQAEEHQKEFWQDGEAVE